MAVCVGSVECKSISSGITSSPVMGMEGHAVTVSTDSMKLACAIVHQKLIIYMTLPFPISQHVYLLFNLPVCLALVFIKPPPF